MTVDSSSTETIKQMTEAALEAKKAEAGGQGLVQYTDGYAYEVPRPFLTLQQAAGILGKSLRSLERSLLGRWGNKLPEGWVARKLRTENGDEWRILPPPGFRVKLSSPGTSDDTEYDTEAMALNNEDSSIIGDSSPSLPARKRQQWKPERHTMDHPTIVIDRSEEVEYLLRDLVTAQRALAEERRLHMEDLRMISQLQSSMRLLETNQAEQSRVKWEVDAAKQELSELKDKYNQELSTPWWRKLFQSGRAT